ncbi:MAG TPA: enoyl-CoA hydratase/isomerase family protein [Spirochaetota bacterium]|nr:enoyl-CoA hydratase/isomerase family protein [Spirochaetota bacterium]HPU89214.1 enoyl-CoA hydratase/isomerase family protein [Spirochaetota bacterium]
MKNDLILYERKGHIALVTLNRPDRRNAFHEAMWTALDRVVDDIRAALPRAIVLTGAGPAFCAGFDVNPDNTQVSGMIEAVQRHEREPAERLVARIRSAVDGFVSLPVPIIAALNGLAYGGGAELAVRCDMRIADPDAVICFSETKLGLMPDWGGGAALARLIGPSRAADLVCTARRVDAGEAFALGLVNRISAPGETRYEALALAESIAQNGPRAVRAALSVVRRANDMPLPDALDYESEQAATLIASGECIHGISAFLTKQKAEFPDD